MHLTEYETTLVVRPDVSGDNVEAMLDRVREVVRGQGGKLVAINHWGKRKLAYEIAKQTRGIYVHTHYLGPQHLVAELERNLRISDIVMRFLTVRLAEKVLPDERQEREYVRPQYDAADEVVHEEVFTAAADTHHGDEAHDEEDVGPDFDADDKEVKE